MQSDAIGVIAPYRSQVTQLKKIVSKIDEKYQSLEMIEVNTVDQYQGRDKELIIFSCTKSRDISKLKMKANVSINLRSTKVDRLSHIKKIIYFIFQHQHH